MLLIDDSEREAWQIDTVLDQGMGADHDVDLASACRLQNFAPIGHPRRTGEQPNEHLIRAGGLDIARDPVVGYVVETSCRFAKPLAFPEVVDAGLRVVRIGNSSVEYDIGLFRRGDEQAAARGRFVHVWVDRATQQPTRVPDKIRVALAPLFDAA